MMKNKLFGLMATLAATAMTFGGAQAVVLETSSFLSNPTYFNGFEGFGTTGVVSGASYSEGGITVTAVGITVTGLGGGYTSPPISPPFIWNGVGNYMWYGFPEYVDIKLTSGNEFQSLQFLASSGWSTPSYLEYQVLDFGKVVGAGVTTLSGTCCSINSDYQTLGFTGGGFNEVRLEATYFSAPFGTDNLQALALDNISATSGVPEASTWAMMLLGFAGLRFAAYRKTARGDCAALTAA